jgi:hypothetical protein
MRKRGLYGASESPEPRRLPIGDTADYQSALQPFADFFLVLIVNETQDEEDDA